MHELTMVSVTPDACITWQVGSAEAVLLLWRADHRGQRNYRKTAWRRGTGLTRGRGLTSAQQRHLLTQDTD